MDELTSPRDWLRFLGRKASSLIQYLGHVTYLAYLVAYHIVTIKSPRRFKWLKEQIVAICMGSLAINSIIIFLIGMVIAFQTAYQMRTFGTESLIPGLVAVSMVRELGPMMTALVVAGRAGAAMTAEIGTMKVTEQIDALTVMSVNPLQYLVSPRFLAMIIGMPLLTIYADLVGILGGFVVCVGKLSLSPTVFVNYVFDAMLLSDFVTGLIKSVVFGAIICLVCCSEGFRVQGGAVGVGKSTMKAVVTSFLLIVAADFGFTFLFYILPI